MGPTVEDPAMFNLWMNALSDHAFEECAVVSTIWCNPLAGYKLATEAGVTQFHFREREDMKWMFLAFGIAGRHGKRAVFSLIRRAFKEEGWWDEGELIGSRGPTWSTKSLGSFAVEFCEFETALQPFSVRRHSERLLAAGAKLRDAEEHYRHAARILEPNLLPPHLRADADRREVAA